VNRGFRLPKALPNREEGEPDRTLRICHPGEAFVAESKDLGEPRERPAHFAGKQNARWARFFKQIAQRLINESSEVPDRLPQQATGIARNAPNASTVAGLARFFPEATPVRIPVQLARSLYTGASGNEDLLQNSAPATNFTESTVIEFGTPREVLFACNTPLEFADVLHLRNSDGSLDVEASVVAVQYHPGQTIVAARFLKDVPNWIVKS
jgi:hypothetical protein